MLVDGNKIAKQLEEKLVTELLFSLPKKVCFIIFGENVTSEQFVKMKTKVAERVGISVETKKYPATKTTAEATRLLADLGKMDYDGIVVQLPLAPDIDIEAVLNAIPPLKDVDVLGKIAKESYATGKINRTPPVAQAVLEIFETHNVKLKGKKIVVAGQGRLVGEPVSMMFRGMKVPHDIIDIKTKEKEKFDLFKNADIIISGIGVPHFIKKDMVKNGVVLIDAGTSEQAGRLVGDIDLECENIASLMTPVPGGVGPITIVCLLRNLF